MVRGGIRHIKLLTQIGQCGSFAMINMCQGLFILLKVHAIKLLDFIDDAG